jgi:formate/nitrite transporter FocA (FNT family)
VLLVNLVGTWPFAALLMVRAIFPPDVTAELHAIAGGTLHHPFWITFLRAVLAGWLIALMVWILPSARSARLLTVLLVTYVVALGHLSHVVAGSSEAAFAVFSGAATIGQYFTTFLVPTLVGNIIGGTLMVTVLNHGSVAPEINNGT